MTKHVSKIKLLEDHAVALIRVLCHASWVCNNENLLPGEDMTDCAKAHAAIVAIEKAITIDSDLKRKIDILKKRLRGQPPSGGDYEY